MNLGDIALSQVLYFHFTTRQFSTGAPITAASLVMSVYKDDSATQSTAGITTTYLTGFDNLVGLVSVKIDTSADGTFYAAGHDFSVVVTTGTADSVSIVGEVVGYFSIQNRSALRPTTAGRTINIDSTGLSDSNMVKMGPTGSGTAQTARDIGASVLLSSGSSTGQLDFTSGVVKSNLVSILGTALTETSGLIAAGFKQFFNIATPTSTMNTITAVTTATTAVNLTTNNDKTGYALSSNGVQAIWDALTSALTTVGSIGKRISDNLDAAISSRSTYAGGDTTGTTTLLTRIASTLTITGGKVDVNDKTGFALTSGYDPAKTAAQAGDTMKVSSGTAAGQVDLTSGKVNVGKINDASVTGAGTSGNLWRG